MAEVVSKVNDLFEIPSQPSAFVTNLKLYVVPCFVLGSVAVTDQIESPDVLLILTSEE